MHATDPDSPLTISNALVSCPRESKQLSSYQRGRKSAECVFVSIAHKNEAVQVTGDRDAPCHPASSTYLIKQTKLRGIGVERITVIAKPTARTRRCDRFVNDGMDCSATEAVMGAARKISGQGKLGVAARKIWHAQRGRTRPPHACCKRKKGWCSLADSLGRKGLANDKGRYCGVVCAASQ
jgi:hypothetical protein